MAYLNNYFPIGYQPYQIYQSQPQPQQQQNQGIIWCQGEGAARSYAVGAGQSVMLMDSEANKFYIKSADQSGMPLPLRIFDYTEQIQQVHAEPQAQTKSQSSVEYITREEFEKRLAEFSAQREQRKQNPQVPRKDKAE